jgi:hypothetical protein
MPAGKEEELAYGDEVMVSRKEVLEHLQRRREVWNVAGVSATICSAKAEPLLILEERGDVERVRRLAMGETWLMQGLSLDNLFVFRRFVRRAMSKARREKLERDVASRTQHSVLSAAVVARAASRLEVLTHRLRLWDAEGHYLVVERLGTGETEVIRCEDGTVVEVEAGALKAYARDLVGALAGEAEAQEPTTRVSGGPRRARKRPRQGEGCSVANDELGTVNHGFVGGLPEEAGIGGMVLQTMQCLDMAERKEAREVTDLLAGRVSQ